MTDSPITLRPNERGTIYVFLADRAPDALKTQMGDVSAIESALGLLLNPAYVDVFKIEDLEGMSLSAFLIEGHGVAIDPGAAAELDTLGGTVVVVTSRAFADPQEVTPPAGWRYIGAFREPAPAPVEPLESASAQGTIAGGKPKSDARIGGMVATVALIVLFLLVALMVWIAA